MMESITREPLTTTGEQGPRRGSRYRLEEVDRGSGLPPALLVTGDERSDEKRYRPRQNPVLIAPSANGTYIGVHSGSGHLEQQDRPGLYELLTVAEQADARDEQKGLAKDEGKCAGDDPGDDITELLNAPRPRTYSWSFGLFDYFGLADSVSCALNSGWSGPKDREQPAPENLRRWVHKRTAQAINERLHAYYLRAIERLRESHPTVVAVQRKVFAATFSTPWLLYAEELYERRHLVSDLIRYRAAAVAVAHASKLSPFRPYRQDVDENLKALDSGNWRGLFSPDGESYRALNRTLDDLPGGVPAGLMQHLQQLRLKEPIRSRASLAVALIYQSMAGPGPDAPRTAFVAEPDRIKRAVSIVAAHTHQPLSFRRTEDLRKMVRFLMDYPGAAEHRGNIVGLAERSVRWHREEAQNAARRQAQRLGAHSKAKPPPVELPREEGIEFLAEVERICREGQFMGNCVGSYANLAVRGEAYLFHAEHKGEHATAQVSPQGRVIQASGPSNRPNGASKWASRVLGRWGKGFVEPRFCPGEDLDHSGWEPEGLQPIPF